MASSRRLPTSYNTSTYGDATRDYTSLATWEAATDNNLVTSTAGEVLECYDDAVNFDDGVALNGATTSSSYFRVIKPATGEGHDGTPNNGVTFSSASYADMFKLVEIYSQVQDIIGINSSGSASGVFFARLEGIISGGDFVGCIAYNSSSLTSGAIRTGRMNSSVDGVANFINCISIECNIGFYSMPGASDVIFYNCSAVDCTTGFDENPGDGSGIVKNCLSCDCTNDFDASLVQTTCYEGDATVFVNQAGDDYHLAAADTTCRGEGTDLSADATYAFDDDIDGDTRSAWDIGADEYAASTPTGGFGRLRFGTIRR